MMETEVIIKLMSNGGVAAVLIAAVWYVSKKLSVAYESRIAALEKHTEECNNDRRKLWEARIADLQKKLP